MKLVDVLINLMMKGYYSAKDVMDLDLDLEEESDLYMVNIIGAVQLFRDETQKEHILTLYKVIDDPEKMELQQSQIDVLAKERSVIDLYHHFKNELIDQGYLSLSNEELAQRIFERYKSRLPELSMITYGVSQWFILPYGRKIVREKFLQREVQLKEKLVEISNVIHQIDIC